MQRVKFDSFQQVKMTSTGNPLVIELQCSSESLEKIKKKLTVKNTSIRFQVERLQSSITFLAKNAAKFVEGSDEHQKYINEINKVKQEIASLKDKEFTEFFEQTDKNTLQVPAGFWFLAGKSDGSHLNKNLDSFFAPGLRDYQKQALLELYKYKRAGICLATGLGKSLIIASICKAAENSGLRACVVVPTDYLVGQMERTIKTLSDSVSTVGGARKYKLGKNICVTTAQSALKVIDNFDVIAVDECHHSPASTWVDIFSQSKATHVYSVTATPYRSDGQDLAIHAFTGPIVYERDARWGISNGWLKPLKVYMKNIKSFDSKGKQIVFKDKYNAQKAYKALSTTPELMSEIKDKLQSALKSGRKCIVLFKTVNACLALYKFCGKELGFNVASAKNKKPLDDFRDGKTNILVSNDRLISEGIDIPDANFLIMVTQNSSRVITSQAVGRVLRKTDGFAIVIDITLDGYLKFSNSKKSRADVYRSITDDVFNIGESK